MIGDTHDSLGDPLDRLDGSTSPAHVHAARLKFTVGSVFVAVALALCVTLPLTPYFDWDGSETTEPKPSRLIWLSTVVAWLTFFAAMVARRLPVLWYACRYRTPSEILRSDKRRPVLYLRSFSDDELASAPAKRWSLHTLEQSLAYVMADVGPFICLGESDEIVRYGATRTRRLGEDEWRHVVVRLVQRARLVIVWAGTSPNVIWELEQAVALLSPHRLMILVPGEADRFQRFRSAAESVLPYSLPDIQIRYGERTPRAAITFGSNWQPAVIDFKADQIRETFLAADTLMGLRLRPYLKQRFRTKQVRFLTRRLLTPLVAVVCLVPAYGFILPLIGPMAKTITELGFSQPSFTFPSSTTPTPSSFALPSSTTPTPSATTGSVGVAPLPTDPSQFSRVLVASLQDVTTVKASATLMTQEGELHNQFQIHYGDGSRPPVLGAEFTVAASSGQTATANVVAVDGQIYLRGEELLRAKGIDKPWVLIKPDTADPDLRAFRQSVEFLISMGPVAQVQLLSVGLLHVKDLGEDSTSGVGEHHFEIQLDRRRMAAFFGAEWPAEAAAIVRSEIWLDREHRLVASTHSETTADAAGTITYRATSFNEPFAISPPDPAQVEPR